MIPEIESFGHAKYIIETQRYKKLNDAVTGNEFNAVCPVNDTTLKLMKDTCILRLLLFLIPLIFTSDVMR